MFTLNVAKSCTTNIFMAQTGFTKEYITSFHFNGFLLFLLLSWSVLFFRASGTFINLYCIIKMDCRFLARLFYLPAFLIFNIDSLVITRSLTLLPFIGLRPSVQCTVQMHCDRVSRWHFCIIHLSAASMSREPSLYGVSGLPFDWGVRNTTNHRNSFCCRLKCAINNEMKKWKRQQCITKYNNYLPRSWCS